MEVFRIIRIFRIEFRGCHFDEVQGYNYEAYMSRLDHSDLTFKASISRLRFRGVRPENFEATISRPGF